MTIVLLLYTFMMYGSKYINKKPWKEFMVCLGVIAFYVVYSLLFGANVKDAVWLDLMQEIRPYSIIFCMWILNPQFTEKQKKWMLITMVATLFSWIMYHPQALDSQVEAEFPVLGQLAICTGMSYYLFTKDTKMNRLIALGLVLTGMLAPKFKFMGEVICFIAFVFFLKKRLNFRSPKTMIYCAVVVAIILMVTWTRFDAYYVSGLDNEYLARPMTYKTSLKILWDYLPFGSGMGTFACNGAWRYYSPLYYKYDLNGIWGLNEGGGFICDAYYPTLAQFGIVGVFFFCWFWKRRLAAADSSWLSGKGMGYCMLIALCLNANRNQMMEMKRQHILKRKKELLLEERRKQIESSQHEEH